MTAHLIGIPGETGIVLIEHADRLPTVARCGVVDPAVTAGDRDTLTNTGSADYQLDALDVVLPVPQSAAESLDFTGRWARERTDGHRDRRRGTAAARRDAAPAGRGFDVRQIVECTDRSSLIEGPAVRLSV